MILNCIVMYRISYRQVDIAGGKLFAVRNDTHVLDDSNVFAHEKILQLIKSLADNCKLGLVVDGRKRDNFLFENTQVRFLCVGAYMR